MNNNSNGQNILGSITNQPERPGTMGIVKKNQSIEINISGNVGKNTYGGSGRNTSMNQS